MGTCRISYWELREKREVHKKKQSEIEYIRLHFTASRNANQSAKKSVGLRVCFTLPKIGSKKHMAGAKTDLAPRDLT